MKMICRIKEVENVMPDMYRITKKSQITKKSFVAFMNLACIKNPRKSEMRKFVKEHDNEEQFDEVKKKFLELFYKEEPKKLYELF